MCQTGVDTARYIRNMMKVTGDSAVIWQFWQLISLRHFYPCYRFSFLSGDAIQFLTLLIHELLRCQEVPKQPRQVLLWVEDF